MHEIDNSMHNIAYFMKWAIYSIVVCPFHKIGKSVADSMKWAKFLPISRNGQFRGLVITFLYIYTFSLHTLLSIMSRDFKWMPLS